MSGLLGGGRKKSAAAQQPVALNAVRFQTAVFGLALPIVYGQNRLPGNVIWYGDFVATPHTSSAGRGSGGKGGGGGGGTGSTTYSYSAAMAIALGEGPIDGIGTVWQDKNQTSLAALGLSLFAGTYPQTPWGYLQTNHQYLAEVHVVPGGLHQVQVIFHGPFLADFGVQDASGHVFVKVGGSPAALQYALDAGSGTYMFSAADAGASVTIRYTAGDQAPRNQALDYAGVAYVAGADYALTDNAELQNHSFEVQGRLRYSPADGIFDADPKEIVSDILTNPNYGAGFPPARLGDLTAYSAYCRASGLFLSPVLDEQRETQEWLGDLAQLTNSAFVWSAGTLKLIPYGDQSASDHGVTFTPDLTPLYDLADDDFLHEDGDDPVRCARSSPADAFNQVQVEFANRNNQYNIEVAEAKDQAAIEAFGLRPLDPLKAHSIADPAVARAAAQLLLQRALYVRNTYEFRLGWRHCLLEPMDLVSLSDAGLGLDQQLVRITAIEEDETGALSVTAEEVPVGSASHARYASATGFGFRPDYNIDPGDVNPPIIFDAPVELAESGLEVWAAVSGGADWGGADVWTSSDGSTYRKVGRISGGARMGSLTAPLASHADPDLADTLAVDLGQSRGMLLSGTKADADLLHTLCWVDGEFVSYRTATLTAANRYDLSYLRRGAYGSGIAAHASGSAFARLDQAIFTVPYTREQIGRTVYLKFVSFNAYGGGGQDIAAVTPYLYQIKGPPPPANVAKFAAQQNGNVVVFHWTQIADFALKGYDIKYGPLGTADWNAMILLTESARGTEMTNASVPPGSWTFAIRARDVADQLSPVMATADLAVGNAQSIVAQVMQAPDWPGTLSGFVRHWTGVLVPQGSSPAAAYGFEVFDQYVPDPVPLATYDAPEIDTGFDDELRVWANIAATLGPGVAGNPAAGLQLDWKTAAGDFGGSFQPWTVGSLTARQIRARLALDTASGAAFIAAFTPTADSPQRIDGAAAVTVAPGGSAIAFARAFHAPPNLQATATGSLSRKATAADITAAGFTAHVFDDLGGDVGGSINWTATGN